VLLSLVLAGVTRLGDEQQRLKTGLELLALGSDVVPDVLQALLELAESEDYPGRVSGRGDDYGDVGRGRGGLLSWCNFRGYRDVENLWTTVCITSGERNCLPGYAHWIPKKSTGFPQVFHILKLRSL